jgi:2-polyprenyl-3-methyl-5-hydroxy-6-metoxy-1,4-benzoquinol methylase
MVHHDVCPLCSSPEISHFLSSTDHLVSKKTFEIYKCEKCGFAFTQDYPEASEAGYYYESDDYISHSDSNKRITDKAYKVVRRIMLHIKKVIIEKTTALSAGSILDIGSGTGHFLNKMKKSGWDIRGVEVNARAREYAASEFKIETISPESMGTLLPDSFDCITLWHVLEHIYDPYNIMKDIGRLLRPRGVCLIALPNNLSFDSRHYDRDWAAYDVPRHLWHFNRLTFSFFAGKNKFTISRYANLPFDVFYISILSEKNRGSDLPVLTGAIKGLWFSVSSFFDRSGRSSVIYVLRKTDD